MTASGHSSNTWAPFAAALVIMVGGAQPALVGARRGRTVSLVASICMDSAYDRAAAGFQFYEELALVPPLGINVQVEWTA